MTPARDIQAGDGANDSVPRFSLAAGWRVVLVSPQTAENVGAVARVMKNLGATDLVVVEPRCEIDAGGAAGKLACWAGDVLAACRIAATLEEALADCHYSLALTMLASEDRPVDFRGFVPAALFAARRAREKRALVFGREDRGLTNEECSRCTARWVIPTSAAAPSLNLAQAVAIALAGVCEAARCDSGDAPPDEEHPATQAEVDALMAHLEQVLRAAKHERGVPIEQTMRLLRRTALRSALRPNEVATLRGVCRRILNEILGYERRP